jgi:hypothetical protein
MRMRNLPQKTTIAKEFVAISAIIELVLATFVGYQFGAGQLLKAWLFTAILACMSYASTRAWIYYFDEKTKR